MKRSFLSGGRAAFVGAAIGAVIGIVQHFDEWRLGSTMAGAAFGTAAVMLACAVVAVILARLLGSDS
jgi:hypothetical protein